MKELGKRIAYSPEKNGYVLGRGQWLRWINEDRVVIYDDVRTMEIIPNRSELEIIRIYYIAAMNCAENKTSYLTSKLACYA